MESIADSTANFNHRLSDGVHLAHADDIYAYITRWGNIRDVYAFLGGIARQFFDHGIPFDELKDEAFNALFVAMHEYDGTRPVAEYASYHTFKAMREYVEIAGKCVDLQPFALMRSPRTFYLRFARHFVPARSLNCSLDYLASKHWQAGQDVWSNTSNFWEAAERIALSLTGKTARNWEIVKACVSGVPYRDLSIEYGIGESTICSAYKRTAARMAELWDAKEASELVYVT